jgi:Zn-dependent M28 family amino/carboxypeptidase
MSFVRSLLRVTLGVAVGLALLALALGAILRRPSIGSLPWRATQHADPGRLRDHVEFLSDPLQPRDIDHPMSLERAAAFVEAELRRHAAERVARQPVVTRYGELRNLIASFGPDSGPRVEVGAHYDSFSAPEGNPGADDNASGTAGLFEVARLLSDAKLSRRVDIVAFTGEEPPLFASREMGSAVYADDLVERGETVEAMLCLEMIGYFSERQPWPNFLYALYYPEVGDFVALVGQRPDASLLALAKRAFRGASDLPVYTFAAPFAVPAIVASDHRSFWQHDIPAILVTDTAIFRNPHYHLTTDRPETLDYERMARVVDGVANTVLHLAASK